jgi:hypothetical protein
MRRNPQEGRENRKQKEKTSLTLTGLLMEGVNVLRAWFEEKPASQKADRQMWLRSDSVAADHAAGAVEGNVAVEEPDADVVGHHVRRDHLHCGQ